MGREREREKKKTQNLELPCLRERKREAKGKKDSKEGGCTSVFVRGFDFGTTEQQIRRHCSMVGLVTSLEMWGKGAAVVSYRTAMQADQAVQQLNNTIIPGNSRYIDVKLDDRGNRRQAPSSPIEGQFEARSGSVPDLQQE